jgi:hypothetical protein
MLWEYTSDDDTITPEYGPLKMMEFVSEGLAALNVEFNAAQRHAQRLSDAGFANIGHHERKVPLGLWPRDLKLKELGRYNLVALHMGLEGIMLAPFTRGLGWTLEEVKTFECKVLKDLKNQSIHAQVRFHAFWAQKPA